MCSAIVKCDVVFLQNEYGVYAVFPNQICNLQTPNKVEAYNMSIGYFEATPELCYKDKEAENYTDLHNKMTSIGYELNVVSKETLVNDKHRKRRESAYKMLTSKY